MQQGKSNEFSNFFEAADFRRQQAFTLFDIIEDDQKDNAVEPPFDLQFDLSDEELDKLKEVFFTLANDEGKMSLAELHGRMDIGQGGDTIETNRKLAIEMIERILGFSEVNRESKVTFEEMIELMKKAMNMR